MATNAIFEREDDPGYQRGLHRLASVVQTACGDVAQERADHDHGDDEDRANERMRW